MILNIGKQEIKINDSDVLYYDESGFLVKTRIMPKVKKFDNIIPSNPKLFTETYIDGQKYFYNNKRGYHKGDKIVFDNGVELKSNVKISGGVRKPLSEKAYYIANDKKENDQSKVKKIYMVDNINEENQNKYDIIIVTPFYKRKDVFDIFLNNLSKLKKDGLNLHAILIGSDSIEGEKEIVESHGFDYLGYENSPLSNKWNFGVSKLQLYNFDFLVVLGSDTIVSKNILKRIYKDMINGGFLIGGVKDAYVYDINNKKGLHWKGYAKNTNRYGETVGISRFYSKELLENMDYKLWDDNLLKNLDGNIYKKTKNINWYKTKINKNEYLIDIRGGEVQLTPFERFKGCSEMPKLNICDILNPTK